MKYLSTCVPYMAWLLLAATCIGGTAAERAPEVLDDASAKAIWGRLVVATHDLDVLSKAKLITKVPAVAADDSVSDLAAALASIVVYWDHSEGGVGRASLPFMLAWQHVLERLFGQDKLRQPSLELSQKLNTLWDEIRPEHHVGFRPGTQYGESKAIITEGQMCARLLQGHYSKTRGATAGDRLAKSLLSYETARCALVTASYENNSRQRCWQSLIRDMPFLCVYGDPEHPRPYVCVGYAEERGKAYLIALDPNRCKPEPVTQLGDEMGRALGEGDADKNQSSTTNPTVVDYWTAPCRNAVPGTVILDADSNFACLFIYNWRYDEKALTERAKQILASRADAKRMEDKP